jgi:hypothetical protein
MVSGYARMTHRNRSICGTRTRFTLGTGKFVISGDFPVLECREHIRPSRRLIRLERLEERKILGMSIMEEGHVQLEC